MSSSSQMPPNILTFYQQLSLWRDMMSTNPTPRGRSNQGCKGRLSRWWWEPIRRSVLRFSGVSEQVINTSLYWERSHPHAHMESIPTSEPPMVITYISRQGSRRSLNQQDHESLVESLRALSVRIGWEFNAMEAHRLCKDEQFAIIEKTTILVGVHGNGLTHLVMLPQTPLMTVIEIYIPHGFTYDYAWTALTLSFDYYAIWNDTAIQEPQFPRGTFPDGFYGKDILIYGPFVASLIEEKIKMAHSHSDQHPFNLTKL